MDEEDMEKGKHFPGAVTRYAYKASNIRNLPEALARTATCLGSTPYNKKFHVTREVLSLGGKPH